MAINYELAQKRRPAQKSALTRAMKTAPEVRYKKVLAVCRQAVAEWNEVGAFPDDWHRWQIALDDAAFPTAARIGRTLSLPGSPTCDVIRA